MSAIAFPDTNNTILANGWKSTPRAWHAISRCRGSGSGCTTTFSAAAAVLRGQANNYRGEAGLRNRHRAKPVWSLTYDRNDRKRQRPRRGEDPQGHAGSRGAPCLLQTQQDIVIPAGTILRHIGGDEFGAAIGNAMLSSCLRLKPGDA
jgi:hypothetical protein